MRGLQPQKRKASFNRQYNNVLYLKYGFISTGAYDRRLNCIFHTTILPMFWMKVLPEYLFWMKVLPDLAVKALKTLLPFATSYLCESGFSVMAATKTKPR